MKNIKETMKEYVCPHCKCANEKVGVAQKEMHYYSMNIEDGDYKESHGSDSIESRRFFCLGCDKKINKAAVEKLICW